ncbi:MAG TPA: monovalent cation:proton antiporter-2 (CPA2) family protein [Flavitalea sp.]|nr:monovalent cation:proton antiporter-2 (CPA2) family protein [Flavitalea sp.]
MHQISLIQAMIFLASAVLFVPIAKKLGLGSVLGYLIAGIAIGPAVLGFVGKEGEDILHFAEFGVVMMLFLIGLELEPELLWKLRKAILGLGGLQVIITSLTIAVIAMSLGWDLKPSLALGMILSLSSTAIVMQTLTEKGLMKSVSGQSAFAVLLFQDIAVIPILAIFPLLSPINNSAHPTGEHHTWVTDMPAWLHTLVVLGTITLIIVAGRYLVRRLLRIVAATRMREVFTATALLLIVGIAVLMMQVGLSPALGTFMAGVVLANSEYKHELESDLEPFKGLLLGLFFIAVGASIDFNLIVSEPGVVFGFVLGLIIVKGIILFLLGKFFKIGKDQNFIFSFALSQVGEFAFVLFSFSLSEGIFDQQTVNLMIAVVAISMALTPLLMLINERLILPYAGGTLVKEEKASDDIDEKNAVIVAGFGHFGNTVGRFLRANNIKATFLDIDSDRVQVLRRMGFKVFFGDASRYDILHAAGAAQAKMIIIAIDSAEKRLEMIDTVKKHFPNLHMFVRATNRYDAYDLMNAGVLHVYRETVDTAVRVGVDVMTLFGKRAYTANRLARTFLKHDEANLKKLASIRDPDEYILAAKNYIEELELIVQADTKEQALERDAGWDVESLREEARGVN